MSKKDTAEKIMKSLTFYIDTFQQALRCLTLLHGQAIERELTKRAVNTTKAIDGLNGLVEEFIEGQRMCMKVMGAHDVPITNNDSKCRLTLVVNNTRKGGK